MKIRALLLALSPALLLSLPACSLGEKFGRLRGQEGQTVVQFAKARSLAALAPKLPGGVMVYAERTDGYRAAFQLVNETDTRQFLLPNGDYKFLAVGWSQAGLTGGTQCGYGGPASATTPVTFKLAGADVDVPIATTVARCGEALFAAENFKDGSLFASPSVAFCGPGATLISKGALDDCSGMGEANARMVRGRTAGGQGVRPLEYDRASGRMVYEADLHIPTLKELYSVKLDGSGTLQQSGMMKNVEGVLSPKQVPNTNKWIFLKKGDQTDIRDIYVTTIGIPGASKLFRNHSPIGSLKWFSISDDGRYIAIVGKWGSSNDELYTAELQDGLAVDPQPVVHRPSPPVGSVVDIENSPYVLFGPTSTGSDGNRALAFLGQYGATGQNVFVTKVGTLPGQQITSALHDSNSANSISLFSFLKSGKGILFRGRYLGSTFPKILYKKINSADTVVEIESDNEEGLLSASPYENYGIYSKFTSSRTLLRRINFDAGGNFINKTDLYVPDNTGVVPFLSINYHSIFWRENGDIVLFADRDTGITNYPLQTLVGGPSTGQLSIISKADAVAKIAPTQAFTNVQFAQDGSIYYLSSGLTTLARISRLSTDPMVNPVEVAAPTLTWDVARFNLFRDALFFTDFQGGHTIGRYLRSGSTSPMSVGSEIGEVLFIKSIGDGAGYPAEYQNSAFILGAPSAGQLSDAFLKKNYQSPTGSDVKRLTHVWTTGNPQGYFRMRMVPYERGPGGEPKITGLGISGDCQHGSPNGGQDGQALTTALRIPTGNIANGDLFLTAIDLYDSDNGCIGKPETFLLTPGIRAIHAGPPNPGIRIATDGGTPGYRIFLRN